MVWLGAQDRVLHSECEFDRIHGAGKFQPPPIPHLLDLAPVVALDQWVNDIRLRPSCDQCGKTLSKCCM